MKTENYYNSLHGTDERTSLASLLEVWGEACENCDSLTPVACITSCKIWRLKNEFRELHEKMKDSIFMTKLLNALKNKRRLQILEIISKGQYSVAKLQQELKRLGYYHSQHTIEKEYIAPLRHVGLAKEDQNRYHATVFGCQLNELIRDFHDIEDVLPPHSECHEETALNMLLNNLKTYEEFESMIPEKSLARVLNRLQKARLIEKAKENDYVFYFRTKRDSNNARFSPTERRVYGNIPLDGISTRKLAEKTGISLRRTYKYLKRLRDKKLVFTRKRPKSYALTARGLQTAVMLKRIHELAVEALATAAKIVNVEETHESVMPDTFSVLQIN